MIQRITYRVRRISAIRLTLFSYNWIIIWYLLAFVITFYFGTINIFYFMGWKTSLIIISKPPQISEQELLKVFGIKGASKKQMFRLKISLAFIQVKYALAPTMAT
jgi:hypothetical protein